MAAALNRRFSTVQIGGAGKACADCDLCCRLYEIDELKKPVHTACVHARGGGCAIHGLHPKTCKTFECLWLMTPELGDLWRPNVAGFVLREEGRSLYVDCDPDHKGAWRRAPYYHQIKLWSEVIRSGVGMVSVEDHGIYVIFPEKDLYLGRLPFGALIEAGYLKTPRGAKPWARLAEGQDISAA